MKKKAKRILLLVVTLLGLIMSLTGCTKKVDSDAQVSAKWNTKTIFVFADKDCDVQLTIVVKEGEESIITIKKVISLSSNETLLQGLNDIAPDFFDDQAEIVDVAVGQPKGTELSWFGWVLLIIVGLFVFEKFC